MQRVGKWLFRRGGVGFWRRLLSCQFFVMLKLHSSSSPPEGRSLSFLVPGTLISSSFSALYNYLMVQWVCHISYYQIFLVYFKEKMHWDLSYIGLQPSYTRLHGRLVPWYQALSVKGWGLGILLIFPVFFFSFEANLILFIWVSLSWSLVNSYFRSFVTSLWLYILSPLTNSNLLFIKVNIFIILILIFRLTDFIFEMLEI